ncbi:MAG: hypothetical protein ABFC34_14990 [Methanobacterium sp.]
MQLAQSLNDLKRIFKENEGVNMRYNNIINEYTNEVTNDMDPKKRDEIAEELKTHILDSADVLAAERNVEVDENIIHEVITKMGPAKDLAKMYPKSFNKKIGSFGRFWIAGLFIAGITGAISFLINTLIFYSKQLIPLWLGSVVQIIIGFSVLFGVLWAYGKLIKLLYEKFNLEKY